MGGRAQKGGGRRFGGLRAAPCSRAAVAHNGARETGEVSTLPIPVQRVGVPLSSAQLSVHLCPLPLRVIRSGNAGAHAPFLRPHLCAKGGEGRDGGERGVEGKEQKGGRESPKGRGGTGGKDWGNPTRGGGGQHSV